MSNLKAILAQYQKNTSKASKRMTSDERLKQYFTTFLPDGVDSLTKKVRILPVGEDESPFIEIMGHKTQVGSQWRTFICPKHENDDDCPFCDARAELLATGDSGDKELAKKFSARKMYVVKVIDRAKEHEGPKFWRFNHDYRKTGILDKIIGVISAVGDSASPNIIDIKSGRDLVISIARDQNGRPTINSIVHSDPSPLHTDSETIENWVNNDKQWSDVYSIKPYSYLEIVVKGGEPAWEKNSNGEGGKWVDKNATPSEEPTDTSEDELTVGGAKPTTSSTEVKPTTVEDDLPF